MTTPEKATIAWADGRSISARLLKGSRSPGVLLAHGAGAGQDYSGIVVLRDGLSEAGFPVATFNYPYIEEGRRSPDRQPVLISAHEAAVEWFRAEIDERVVLAGRSMGGRIGTMLAAEGAPCAGLISYAYPLHPIGKPERLRKDHLTAITQPMLFFIGTRDGMAKPDLVDRWIRPLPNVTVHAIDDGDHSFRVRKAAGRTQEEVFAEIVGVSVDWLEKLSP